MVDLIESVFLDQLADPFGRGQLKMVMAFGANLEVFRQVLGIQGLSALVALDP